MPKKSVPSSKARQKVKLALLVLSLIVLLVLSAQLAKIVNNFSKPLTPGITTTERTLWEGKYPLSFILHNSSLALVYFDPGAGELTVIDLPKDDTFKNTDSVDDLQKAVESKLRVPIDGYIQVSSNLSDTPFEAVEKLRSNPWEWFLNLKSIRSDLTAKEILDLSVSLPKVRFDKVKNYQLEGENVSSHLKDNLLVNDQATVAVFNATVVPGLAQKVAVMISNLGGNVIIVSNTKSKNLKKSYVWTKDNAPAYSKTRLARIFTPNCTETVKCDILEDSEIVSSRAQINIILGQDFIEKF